MEPSRAAWAGEAIASKRRILIIGDASIDRELQRSQGWDDEGTETVRVSTEEEARLIAHGSEACAVVAACRPDELGALVTKTATFPEHVGVFIRVSSSETGGSGTWLGMHPSALPGAPCIPGSVLSKEGEEAGDNALAEVELKQIRAALARVSHDIKNPLSIVSGNAQLLLELARVMDLDEDIVQPVRDIEEASRRMAGMLNKLAELSQRTF